MLTAEHEGGQVTGTPTREKPPNFLEVHADNHPDKRATVGPERSLTYGRLRERARALAGSLYALGVRPGDQVALMTYNDPTHAEVAQALYYLEVGLVMVGYRMKPREIEFIVDNSDSRIPTPSISSRSENVFTIAPKSLIASIIARASGDLRKL